MSSSEGESLLTRQQPPSQPSPPSLPSASLASSSSSSSASSSSSSSKTTPNTRSDDSDSDPSDSDCTDSDPGSPSSHPLASSTTESNKAAADRQSEVPKRIPLRVDNIPKSAGIVSGIFSIGAQAFQVKYNRADRTATFLNQHPHLSGVRYLLRRVGETDMYRVPGVVTYLEHNTMISIPHSCDSPSFGYNVKCPACCPSLYQVVREPFITQQAFKPHDVNVMHIMQLITSKELPVNVQHGFAVDDMQRVYQIFVDVNQIRVHVYFPIKHLKVQLVVRFILQNRSDLREYAVQTVLEPQKNDNDDVDTFKPVHTNHDASKYDLACAACCPFMFDVLDFKYTAASPQPPSVLPPPKK